MTSDHEIHVGKPPFFDGNNYDYWKTRMSAHLKAMSRKLWRVVSDGYEMRRHLSLSIIIIVPIKERWLPNMNPIMTSHYYTPR